MCPLELRAMPATSPRLNPSGSFSGFDASNGISGWANRGAQIVSAVSNKVFTGASWELTKSISGRRLVHRVGARFQRAGLAVFQIQHDRFVRSLLQPRCGDEESLLGTDAPVAAQVVAVDPDGPFAPTAHVEEGVAGCR